MATTVTNNPFDTTQQQSSSGGGIIGGTIQKMDTPVQPQSYTAQEREVNRPTETAAGQVESMLAKDSPLMQRARTLAMQNMNQRGLVNSSMAQGAGVAAMIDRATPIAQQDAQIYSNRALANQQAVNEAISSTWANQMCFMARSWIRGSRLRSARLVRPSRQASV